MANLENRGGTNQYSETEPNAVTSELARFNTVINEIYPILMESALDPDRLLRNPRLSRASLREDFGFSLLQANLIQMRQRNQKETSSQNGEWTQNAFYTDNPGLVNYYSTRTNETGEQLEHDYTNNISEGREIVLIQTPKGYVDLVTGPEKYELTIASGGMHVTATFIDSSPSKPNSVRVNAHFGASQTQLKLSPESSSRELE